MTPEEIKKLVDDLSDKLGEHVESVRIFVTFSNEGSKTGSYTTGRGNYYASYGVIAEYMTMQDEYIRLQARADRG